MPKSSNLAADIGSQFAAIRKSHGLSQAELAELAGVDRTYVVKVEAGVMRRLEVYQKIARVLNCHLKVISSDHPVS